MKIKQILPWMGVWVMTSFAMAQTAPSQRWDFDKDRPGQIPAGFESYSGEWKVKLEPTPEPAERISSRGHRSNWPASWPGIRTIRIFGRGKVQNHFRQ